VHLDGRARWGARRRTWPRLRCLRNLSGIIADMVTTLWSRWGWPILSGRTRQVALPIALVVGTILLAVNQGAELVAGDADLATVLRALANYAIPYVVSSVGFLNGRGQPGSPSQEVSSP
jgi:hypothetical protein